MATIDSTDQIKAIHTMLEKGHQSIQLEKHTLALWGITIALLIVFLEWTFRLPFYYAWIPSDWLERQLVKVAIVAGTLSVVIWLDTLLTSYARKKRDQSVSYIQQRLRHIYWMMVAFFVLFILGTLFYGGTDMIYGMGIIIVGMAFYIQGLFSAQMLRWCGSVIILSGILCVLFDSPLTQMCLAISIFGLGFPLLGWVITRKPENKPFSKIILATTIWGLSIVLATWGLNSWFGYHENSNVKTVSYENFRLGKTENEEFLVDIPAGTIIPILVNLETNLTNYPARARMELKLAEDMQLAVDKNLNQFLKYGENPWLNKHWHVDKTPKIKGFFINRNLTSGEIYLRYDF